MPPVLDATHTNKVIPIPGSPILPEGGNTIGASGLQGNQGNPGPIGPAGPRTIPLYFSIVGAAIAADTFMGQFTRAANATESVQRLPVPAAGTIQNLRLKSMGGNITVANCIVTARLNGVDQTLTATIAVGAATAADAAHSFAVLDQDNLTFRVTGNGTTIPATGLLWAECDLVVP